MGKKILVIDDNQVLLKLVERVLAPYGYEVFVAGDGLEGLRLLFTEKPDLVLLDMGMPKMNGWQVCQRIREVSDVPVIILTGERKSEADIVRALDYGADEYLVKPVGVKELVARVRAVLRRSDLPLLQITHKEVNYSDDFLTVDIGAHKVTVNGEHVKLTPREFRLFAFLVENAGRIVTHKQILERVWGWEYTDDLDYVRIYISHLRHKIEPDFTLPRYIVTEPGVGYSFHRASW